MFSFIHTILNSGPYISNHKMAVAELVVSTEYIRWIEQLPKVNFTDTVKDFFTIWLKQHAEKITTIPEMLKDHIKKHLRSSSTKPIIIFDIDETLLCSLVKVGAPSEWYAADIDENFLPPAPGAVECVNELRKMGAEIWLVSSRPKSIYGETAKNLDRVKINYDKLLLVGEEDKTSVIDRKAFACIGDKFMDLEFDCDYKFLLINPFY